jgi:hypothetical protein
VDLDILLLQGERVITFNHIELDEQKLAAGSLAHMVFCP